MTEALETQVKSKVSIKVIRVSLGFHNVFEFLVLSFVKIYWLIVLVLNCYDLFVA